MRLKVIACNGSPNVNGNTAYALKVVSSVLENHGIETEILQVGSALISPCSGCRACAKTGMCAITGDDLNLWIRKLEDADGIILGSPVYFAGIASPMKCFLDRAFYILSRGRKLRGKIGAAVVAVRRSGGSAAYDNLMRYLSYSEMLIATGSYWTIIHGRDPGEAREDIEGNDSLTILAENMVWALRIREEALPVHPCPDTPRRRIMSFIR